jgi:hypothetical protein
MAAEVATAYSNKGEEKITAETLQATAVAANMRIFLRFPSWFPGEHALRH